MIENPQVGDFVQVIAGYNTGQYGKITKVTENGNVNFYEADDYEERYNVEPTRLKRVKESDYIVEKLEEARENVRDLERELEVVRYNEMGKKL